MEAEAPLSSFAALLPCSPARPPPPPQLPPPPLPPASRSSPAPLACLPNLPSFTPKIISSPPAVSPTRARRRHVLLVAPAAGGGAGQAAVARAVPARPWVRVGRRVAGLRAGRRLGRAPAHGGGGGGFRPPPRRLRSISTTLCRLPSSFGVVPSSWFRPEPLGIDAAPQLCARRGKNEIRLLNTDPAGPEVRVLEQLRDTVDFTFQRRDKRAVYLTRTWHRLHTNTANVDVAHYCEEAGQKTQTARRSSSIRRRGGTAASDGEDSIGGRRRRPTAAASEAGGNRGGRRRKRRPATCPNPAPAAAGARKRAEDEGAGLTRWGREQGDEGGAVSRGGGARPVGRRGGAVASVWAAAQLASVRAAQVGSGAADWQRRRSGDAGGRQHAGLYSGCRRRAGLVPAAGDRGRRKKQRG